jgi:hypothetical protein
LRVVCQRRFWKALSCGGKRLTSGDIEIRKAQRADYEKVAEMHYPVWLESYTGIVVPYLLDIFVKAKDPARNMRGQVLKYSETVPARP